MFKIGVTEGVLMKCIPDVYITKIFFEEAKLNRNYDALLVGLDTELTIERWHKFKRPIILSPTTNISHIPKELWSYVIKVDSVEIDNITATAEHTFCLFLMACRRMKVSLTDPREKWMGQQIFGMNAAIFGFGRIGKLLANYCKAFGMNIEIFDKGSKGMVRLLNWADVIFISMTYDDATRGFFNINYLEDFKVGQILVNTSRAQIVDKDLLIAGLKNNVWKFVCMDFINYDDKPHYFDPALLKYFDKLILTPHVAGNTKESLMSVVDVVLRKFLVKNETSSANSK